MTTAKPTPAQLALIARAVNQIDEVPGRLRRNCSQLLESASGPFVTPLTMSLRNSEQQIRAAMASLTAMQPRR
jgi:hypothetical protein